jgi:hypothetical protein
MRTKAGASELAKKKLAASKNKLVNFIVAIKSKGGLAGQSAIEINRAISISATTIFAFAKISCL